MVWHGLVRSCATAQFRYCRLSNRTNSPCRSFTKPKNRAQQTDSFVTRRQIRVEQLEIKHRFFCQPACERFPIDSHSLDIGLGRAPPVDFPRICSCALASEKGASIPMLSPRDGQALAESLKENNSLQTLALHNNSIGDAGAEAPGWGGSPKGLDGEVCEEKRKGVGDVVGPCVLVSSW